MGAVFRPHPVRGLAAAAAVVCLSSCGGSSPAPTPSPPVEAPAPVPGVTTVNGSERLAWSQAGGAGGLQFRAYVDGSPVALSAATCDGATPDASCSSPLPSLSNGVHSIALSAVSSNGMESPQSAPIQVQKVSASSAIGAASLPDARSPGEPQLQSVVTAYGGLAFTADVVARSLQAPVQLASSPDGRLFVAQADGRVRILRPGAPGADRLALDARALITPPPMGALGIALHPDFAENGFVYLALLSRETSGDARLRVVRLREAGDTLGEPATLFEAPVAGAGGGTRVIGGASAGAASTDGTLDGPRAAFGPDGLFYVALPQGLEFRGEPLASRPRASMLRIDEHGERPDAGALSGVVTHPLGFAWHPTTRDLWAIFRGDDDEAVVQAVSDVPARVIGRGFAVLRWAAGAGGYQSGVLAVRAPEAGVLDVLPLLQGVDHTTIGTVRLAAPIRIDGLLGGMSGEIGDVVAGAGGTLYLAASSRAGGSVDTRGPDAHVVVRLTPVPR